MNFWNMQEKTKKNVVSGALFAPKACINEKKAVILQANRKQDNKRWRLSTN
jgi:hypothetical protein